MGQLAKVRRIASSRRTRCPALRLDAPCHLPARSAPLSNLESRRGGQMLAQPLQELNSWSARAPVSLRCQAEPGWSAHSASRH